MDIIWISAAFIFGFLVSQIRIPPLVGFLLAGIILSLTPYESGQVLEEISHLGVIFLLFTVGLHIKLENILSKVVLGVGLIHLAISTLIYSFVAVYFGFELTAAIIIGITLGFSSTVITAKTLESRNEIGSYYGRMAIGILIVQDIIAIGIIAFTGQKIPSIWALTLLGLPLLRPVILKIINWIREEELLIIFSIFLALAGAYLFEFFNLSGELGALAIGMMLPNNDKKVESLEKNMWSIKEAFLVGFFLSVGLTGLPNLMEMGFVLFVILLLPIKGLLFFLLFSAFRLRARTSFMTSVTLTAYSEFTLIAGVVAYSNDFIPESAIIALGLITSISYAINSPLTIVEDRIWNRFKNLLTFFQRKGKHPEKEALSFGAAEYVVIGMGGAGKAAYDELSTKKKRVLGVEVDPDAISANIEEGRRVVYEDLLDSSIIEIIDFSKVKAIVITIKRLQSKLMIIKNLRKGGYSGSIFVLTRKENEAKMIQEAGAFALSIPVKQAGHRIATLCLSGEENVEAIKMDVKKPNVDPMD